jgi:hypothetical protein
MEATVNTYRRYSKHNSPSAEQDIKSLTRHLIDHKFHEERPRSCTSVPDYARKGSMKLTSPKYLAKFHKERTWSRATTEIWDEETMQKEAVDRQEQERRVELEESSVV